MTVQAVEVTSVREVPDNGYWSAGGLGIPYSEIGNSLHHAQHAFTDKRVVQ